MEIEITRPKQYQDKIRDYYLWADDKEIGKVKPNSIAIYSIPDNAQNIRFTIDWCSSPEFAVKDIQSNKLTVFNSFGSNWISALFLQLYYITLGKNKYLTVKSGI
ncbi:hypothetical protein [Pleionea sediminis]|uniref:hypothetical protein n=1 Tax=Pleionea sediminis TaxID=2569479 RepID=UPI001184A30E|nr:hypothetical protein [Pleionea sediminis]